ncbi:MAG: hypothetical protein FJX64_09220, partial [Alphaproteobacteria bacterium]|nr:hypothetical protein [Alphaproteobacteria bacterium]
GEPLVHPPPPPPPVVRPIARPAGNQPMRVSGPTAVASPPPAALRPAPPRPKAAPQRPASATSAARPASPPAPPRKPAAPAAQPPAPAKPGVNPQDYVGKEYTLWKPIAGGRGSLRIGGVDWSLVGSDVPAGTRVRVVGVDG